MRAVVADDDPDARTLSMRALAQEWDDLDAVEVAGPADLDEALRMPPDLLVTDYDLRWTDGFAILQQVRAAYPACPAVMFTGTGNEDLAVRAMKAGFDDYVVKSHTQLKRLAAACRIVVERGRATRALVDNRDLVLAELYHRLHNNLQIVISLIRQTEKVVQNTADRRQLTDLRQRIQALSALQEQFYRSPDFRRVDFSNFLGELAGRLVGLAPVPVTLSTRLEPLELPVDAAVPLGLLANELITDAVRRANSKTRGGELSVCLEREGGRVVLTVADNGVGPGEQDTTAASGIGLHLVERLAQQVDGEVVRTERAPGTEYRVSVPL